jgi:uncharacterized protein YgiM (DUF1202 family)
MSRTIFLIIFLGLVALGCSKSAQVAQNTPVVSATAAGGVVPAGQTPQVAVLAVAMATETMLQCVGTSAEVAQNLREGAGIGYQVIGALLPGEAFEVVNMAGAEWWQVRRGGAGWMGAPGVSQKS